MLGTLNSIATRFFSRGNQSVKVGHIVDGLFVESIVGEIVTLECGQTRSIDNLYQRGRSKWSSRGRFGYENESTDFVCEIGDVDCFIQWSETPLVYLVDMTGERVCQKLDAIGYHSSDELQEAKRAIEQSIYLFE